MKARHCAATARRRPASFETKDSSRFWAQAPEIKNGVGLLRDHAAGISHQRGSWLACRREILLNLIRFEPLSVEAGIYPAKIAAMRGGRFISDSEIFIA